MARGLGWFSIALGVAEIAASRPIARCLGVESGAKVIQACGVRGIVNGVGILADRRPRQRARWVAARAAGDAVDVVLLGAAATQAEARRPRLAALMGAVGILAIVGAATSTLLSER
jgi:hypothetical protein